MTTTATEATDETPVIADQITMYSTPWCGYCRQLKSQLKREGIDFVEVDIEQVPEAAEYVMSVNGGNQTVPTVVVLPASGAEKVAMTNPSLAQVKAALAS
jgi:mycoredoxin